ncbi:hypothetical protein N2W24_002991 [Clostridium perfringens]|nr:hypothetical protein [Clostridium perfringens]EJT6484094.1 hypothetical protein [Clostridium perfringens]ELP5179917.1 hypothetical protein [Clostridium perfringens]MDM1013271.1 hypothetical protein [Clostridium perfringens]
MKEKIIKIDYKIYKLKSLIEHCNADDNQKDIMLNEVLEVQEQIKLLEIEIDKSIKEK